jgi:hypothetical protein
VQAGTFGFQGPLPTQAAITLQSAGADDVTGLDFRSGPLPLPIADQTPHLEIVVAPKITIPAQQLHDWAGGFTPVSQQLTPPAGAPLGPAQATIAAVSVTAATNSLTVSASGSFTGTLLGVQLPLIPASADVSLSLTPSANPKTDEVVQVGLAGSNPVRVQTSSPLLTAVADLVVSLLSSFIGNLIQQEINDLLHQLLTPATARGLALPALPDSTSVSLRNLGIDADGISFQPALGAIGTALSTFQPTPLPAA